VDRQDIASDMSDAQQAIRLAADLIERLVVASNKWQRDERVMLLKAVDDIRALASPETRQD
jgi:hypothetical protein